MGGAVVNFRLAEKWMEEAGDSRGAANGDPTMRGREDRMNSLELPRM